MKLGGNLASYHNSGEITFVIDFIKSIAGKAFNTWTGGYDSTMVSEEHTNKGIQTIRVT